MLMRSVIIFLAVSLVAAVVTYNFFGNYAELPGKADLEYTRTDAMQMYDKKYGGGKQWLGDKPKPYEEDNNAIAADLYFTLTTEFMEWGWGDAIHMAPMYPEYTFKHSMNEWELWFAHRIGITKGAQVVDLGMGIGGPMRRLSAFTDSNITGVTICAFQVERALALTPSYLKDSCHYVEGDYSHTSLPSNTYDVVYFMESLSHCGNRTNPLREAYRLLKPGGTVGAWQWMLKDTFDCNNEEHMELKRGMEYGGGLSNLNKPHERIEEFKLAGLVVTESFDMMDAAKRIGWKHWSIPLINGHDMFTTFTSSYIGRRITSSVVYVAESLGLAEPGTVKISLMMEHCGYCAAEAGKLDIFTPLWFNKAYKPK